MIERIAQLEMHQQEMQSGVLAMKGSEKLLHKRASQVIVEKEAVVKGGAMQSVIADATIRLKLKSLKELLTEFIRTKSNIPLLSADESGTSQTLRCVATTTLMHHCAAASVAFVDFISCKYKGELDKLLLYFLKYQVGIGGLESSPFAGGGERSVRVTLVRLFPHFLSDPAYNEWCGAQMSLPMTASSSEIEFTLERLFVDNAIGANLESLYQLLHLTTLVQMPDCALLLKADGWLKTFSELVENIPLSVYMSIADEKKGFPVVYVNRHLELTTGYRRQELQGHCNPFLNHSSVANPEVLDNMREALSKSLPCKAKFRASYRDGKVVPVTLLSKPMYDTSSRLRYIFTVQTEDGSTANMAVIGGFMAIAPNIVYESVV